MKLKKETYWAIKLIDKGEERELYFEEYTERSGLFYSTQCCQDAQRYSSYEHAAKMVSTVKTLYRHMQMNW